MITACDLFNISVPGYIDEYIHTAEAGNYIFVTPIVDTIGSMTYIPKDFEMELTIRNPQRYTLCPILEYKENGEWKKFPIPEYYYNNIVVQYPAEGGALIEAEYDADKTDKVRIKINDSVIGNSYTLRLSLKNLHSGVTYDGYELPLFTCLNKPHEVKNLSVIPRATNQESTEFHGLDLSWEQELWTKDVSVKDISDADKLVISCDGFASETYGRTFDNDLDKWSSWETEDQSKSINFSDPSYRVTFAADKQLNPQANYTVNLLFTNETGLQRGQTKSCFTGNGNVRVDIINGAGEPTGSTQHHYTLQAALASISENQTAVITLTDTIPSLEAYIIDDNKKITIKAEGYRTIQLSGTGSLFTVESGTTLILEGSAGNILTLAGIGNNNKALVWVDGGTLEMKEGAEITGNTNSADGGGVHVSGTFIMTGGSINKNRASSGGGVYIESGGIFTMEGGIIGGSPTTEGNSAGEGGGVCVTQGSFEMKGDARIIYNNVSGTISKGGGVFLSTSGSFDMSGNAEISSNSSTGSNSKGSGVYVDSGSFDISGAARIDVNNDIYLSTGQEIDVGVLTGTGTIGIITPQNYRDTPPVKVLAGEAEILSGAYSRFGVTPPGSGVIWTIDSLGMLKKAVASLQVGMGTPVYYATLGEAFNAVLSDQTVVITLLADIPDQDISISAGTNKNITLVPGSASRTISLNNSGNSLFTILSGVKLILKGTSGNSLTLAGISGGGAYTDSPLITVNAGGILEVNTDVFIEKNRNYEGNGGGVSVSGIGSFLIMNGGTIRDNESINDWGGGVYVNGGTFTMAGGTIEGNKALKGGGVYVNGGTFTLKSGTIKKNSASTDSDGGGVYVTNTGKFIMEGGIIGGDSALDKNSSRWGGGVYVAEGGIFTMKGGDIKYNSVTQNGGGVFVKQPDGSFTMEGGTISFNSATGTTNEGWGGGVYMNGGTFTMKNGSINGNDAKQGGGVHVFGVGNFTMEGGSISTNTASLGKGVYYMSTGTFTMKNGARVNTDNDIYLPTNKTINVEGFTGTDTIGTITPETYTSIPVLFGTAQNLLDCHLRFKVKPDAGTPWLVSYEGKLQKDP